jgi:ferric-dicitrate binding protein FerR (iron transport regulator)
MTRPTLSRFSGPALAALITLAALAAYGALSARTIGSVRSSSTFRLSGNNIPVEGTRAWPVVPGDELATGAEPAILDLADGSRITVAAESKVKIEAQGARTAVRLMEGALQYRLSDTATTDVYNRTDRVQTSTGALSTSRKRPPPKPPGRHRPPQPPPVSPWR